MPQQNEAFQTLSFDNKKALLIKMRLNYYSYTYLKS